MSKYKVYYKNDKCLVYSDESLYNIFHTSGSRHIWPEDNTEITLTYSNNRIYFNITNLSDRAQYLSDCGLLGVGLFVRERHIWVGRGMISESAKLNHPDRRCMCVQEDPGLSGYFELSGDNEMSDALYTYFSNQNSYEDDPAQEGDDDFYIGIGRYCDPQVYGFRPFKMSEGINIIRYNDI